MCGGSKPSGGGTQIVYRDLPPPQVAKAPSGGIASEDVQAGQGGMQQGGGVEGGAGGLLSTRKKNLLG